MRHHRSDAYSAEQVLLNKRQIYGGTPNYTDTLLSFYCISILENISVLVSVYSFHIIFISVSVAVFISVSGYSMLDLKSIALIL